MFWDPTVSARMPLNAHFVLDRLKNLYNTFVCCFLQCLSCLLSNTVMLKTIVLRP